MSQAGRSNTSARSLGDAISLEEAHRQLGITPDEFDAVADELARSLDFFKVPAREKGEVLAAFAAHKGEVTEGSIATTAS
jgi:hemoglobin